MPRPAVDVADPFPQAGGLVRWTSQRKARAGLGAGSQQHAHPACPRHLRAAWAPCDGTTPMWLRRLDHAPERHRRRHGARGVGMVEKGSLAQSQSALDLRGSCADHLATLRRCNATVPAAA